ncbi:gliding motility-associated C-terminal domain-containing protein [Mucilaginibacter aquariorum]|uniref:Gliding motility-associated C-terminal domain-containing protein n=1 Tax=Mucilaginibacter aquariorum TaxID=2967225 RepID=A0ABT1T4H2_9SPHI|nr:gliding motility-associated C-terminal domain-containing protein [Mucilaginibacter aquariorum]
MRALRVVITFVLVCCSYLGFAQGTSSQGKEFWTAFMSHIDAKDQISKMSLYITADENTSGKVEIADNSFPAIPFNVTARQVTIVTIPKSAFLKKEGKFLKGLHIIAEKKIAVYAHIYASSVSGATLLLPVAVLGKTYYSINYKQEANVSDAYSSFMIVATEDNTTVEITPSQQLLGEKPAGQTFPVTLKKGEVYQGLSDKDLTNTKIRSISTANGECKKIAVFSGSTKIGIGCHDNNFTSDNLFQQVYPTTAWGINYITIPLKSRNYDIFRVFCSEPNTFLKINGAVIPPASIQNNVYEFSSDITNNITANKPIQVIQYAVTQGKVLGNGCQFDSRDIGDPEMIYLNPLEQTLDHVTLYSARADSIINNYINVVIRADKAATFKLDGVPYTKFVAILNNQLYSYAQIPVSAGTHYISADGGFNAIAYGFGQNESYGYSAGANLRNLNEYIAFENPETNAIQLNGCTNETYKLQLVLPYPTTKINWSFNNIPILQIPNPIGIPFQKDGKTLYRYEYPGTVQYQKGSYNYTATVIAPDEDCGTSRDIDFDFSITDRAIPGFSYGSNLCAGDEVIIHDDSQADPGSVSMIKICYDFVNHPEIFETFNKSEIPADGNYRHLYGPLTAPTNFTVKMIVYTGEDALCDNGIEHVITVNPSPVVSINAVNPMCQAGGAVQLIADVKGGTFSGTGVNSAGLFDPAISGPGAFTITYHFIAQNSCDATAERIITVNPLPAVNAGNDLVLLEGESVILPATASGNGLSYEWTPARGLDNKNALNPISSAIEDTFYKLTVTTDSGCVATDEIIVKVLKKPLVVNAFTPNGDGVNDTWNIKYLETYPGNTVDIYNRQGEKVYSSVGYASPWDGRYKGTILPTGTYYYIINPKNGRKLISGNITIIK